MPARVYCVLQGGGILRIAVPDLDSVVAEYDPADPDTFLRGIYEGNSARRNRASQHQWQYNALSMDTLLRRVGFREIEVCEYQAGRCRSREDRVPAGLAVRRSR